MEPARAHNPYRWRFESSLRHNFDMATKKTKASLKVKQPDRIKIDFENDDGTIDEWVYDNTVRPMRAIQVTVNIRRRTKNRR